LPTLFHWIVIYPVDSIIHPLNNWGQVQSKDEKLLTAEDEQLNRWREYFEELLNRPLPAIAPNIPPAKSLLNIKTEPPSKGEIRKALQHLKNDKAQGPDGILPENVAIW